MKTGKNDENFASKLNKIIYELQKFSVEIITLNPPLKDDSIISEFENKYRVILPYDYKAFLKHFDGINLMGTQVLGFSDNYNIINVYEFEHFEVTIPQYDYLVPFSPDGRGNFYCFDTRELNSIVFWTSNYNYTTDDQPEKVNESFFDWIQEVVILWTLESYGFDGNPKVNR